MTDESDARAAIDALVKSFFSLFSNRNGVVPDLGRIHHLFVPRGVVAKCLDPEPEIYSVEDFVAPRQELLTSGRLTEFSEEEVSGETRIFGHIAQRLSSYEKSGVMEGRPFVARGVKSFQFIRTTDGWRILSVIWDDERDGA